MFFSFFPIILITLSSVFTISILYYFFKPYTFLIIGFCLFLIISYMFFNQIIFKIRNNEIINKIKNTNNKQELISTLKEIQNKYFKGKTTEKFIFLEKIDNTLVITLLLDFSKNKNKRYDFNKIIVTKKYKQDYENNDFQIFDTKNIFLKTNDETDNDKILRALKIFLYENNENLDDIYNPMSKLDKLTTNSNLNDFIGDTYIENYYEFLDYLSFKFLKSNIQKEKFNELLKNNDIYLKNIIDIILIDSKKVEEYLTLRSLTFYNNSDY